MKYKFSPMMFLASLGAGGISIIPFAFLNYTYPHAKGLVKAADVVYGTGSLWDKVFFGGLELVMLAFVLIHLLLTIWFTIRLWEWMKRGEWHRIANDPIKNNAVLAPFISYIMTMNVGIAGVRYFVPVMAENLQTMMLPALLVWGVLWILLMRLEIKLLKTAFESSFDLSNINFGWLLHPFALGMLTVTGMGIAALSSVSSVAHVAAFMSLISGSMGLFLLIVKTMALFQKHFQAEKMPERQFLPSFLIVIPNVTLYAISMFRFGHYIEHHFNFEMEAYFMIVMTLAFAFETWYMMFGLSLLKEYLSNYFNKEFYVSQWGLVCPVVAYAVLGSFVHNVFVGNMVLYYLVPAVMIVAIILFVNLMRKQFRAGI